MKKEIITAVIGVALLCGTLSLCTSCAVEPGCKEIDFGQDHWDGKQFIYVPDTRCIAPGKRVE